MKLNPEIFKAYDVRGTYPDEVHEEAARAIGAAFVTYLGAKHIGVGRDMRLSSPAIAAAFIDGAIGQGVEVIDYGMIPTDVLYFAVARDELDGGVEITASHNPKQYNGMKMVRREAFPLSGEAGISDIRDMIAGGRLPPPASSAGRLHERNVVVPYVEHVLSFIDTSVIRPFNVVLDAGAAALSAAALPDDEAVLRDRRPISQPRSEPAHRREPPRHRRARGRGQGRYRDCLGRRCRPLLLHRRRR
jgi:phosphomannomutase